LKDDISEANDLSHQQSEVANRLLEELGKWTKKVNAPIPAVLNLSHAVDLN
jgi:hypothetical protein